MSNDGDCMTISPLSTKEIILQWESFESLYIKGESKRAVKIGDKAEPWLTPMEVENLGESLLFQE